MSSPKTRREQLIGLPGGGRNTHTHTPTMDVLSCLSGVVCSCRLALRCLPASNLQKPKNLVTFSLSFLCLAGWQGESQLTWLPGLIRTPSMSCGSCSGFKSSYLSLTPNAHLECSLELAHNPPTPENLPHLFAGLLFYISQVFVFLGCFLLLFSTKSEANLHFRQTNTRTFGSSGAFVARSFVVVVVEPRLKPTGLTQQHSACYLI